MELGCKKRGQVTIFIILAVIIVVGIVSIFIFFGGFDILTGKISNPVDYVKKCAGDNAEIVLENIEQHGGVYYEASDYSNFLKFDGLSVAKLCYSDKEKVSCENRHPLFIEEIENKIRNIVKPKLEKCFEDIKNSYSPDSFIEGDLDFRVNVIKEGVSLIIRKDINILNEDDSVKISNFDVSLDSDIYSFLEVTNSILNQELACDCEISNCNVDLGKMNVWYPNYATSRFLTEEGEKIYTILSNDNENKFMFVIRNCARVEL